MNVTSAMRPAPARSSFSIAIHLPVQSPHGVSVSADILPMAYRSSLEVPIYVLAEQRAVARIGLSLEREFGQIRPTGNLILGAVRRGAPGSAGKHPPASRVPSAGLVTVT
jgi:hypothetical protein